MMAGEPIRQDDAPRPTTTERLREQWRSVARGWNRWDAHFSSSTWPVTAQLMLDLRLQPGFSVLDVGCGIGEPSLQIAYAVGSEGHVLALDLSADMIEIAASRARALGLGNIEYRVGSLEDLEASAGPFDAVASRFTICLFSDLSGGLTKLRDFVRPGGRVAVSTWASMDENPMFAIPSRALGEVADFPKPPRDAPGSMRLSKPGELQQALEGMGLVDVRVKSVRLYNFARDPQEYFSMLCETAPGFQAVYYGLTQEQQARVREDVTARIAEYEQGGVIRVPAAARVGCGMRPVD